MGHRRKSHRFSAADTGVTLPTHWWDLDDDGVWAGQGTKDGDTGWTDGLLGSGVGTTSQTIGGGGSRTVANMIDTQYLEFDNSGTKTVAWDGANNDQFSMSLWLRATALASSGNWLMSWRGASASPENRFVQFLVLNSTPDRIYSDIWDSSGYVGAASDNTPVDTTWALNKWWHATVTLDASGNYKLYIGDENNAPILVDTLASSYGTIMTEASPFALGTQSYSKGTASGGHAGQMHAAGIWDVALTASEITTIWNNGDGANYSEIWT